MGAQSNAKPVIIKRKKVVGGGGHHGGAWKVAYADFVTAMMAFFLLMWLLNATTEQQRKGISDYFSPTVPISRTSGGGDGAFGGESVFSQESLLQSGSGASQPLATSSQQVRGEMGLVEGGNLSADQEADAQAFSTIEAMLTGRSGESMVSDDLLRHIVTRVTDEGLVIEIFELPGALLFEPDQTSPTRLLQDLSMLLASAANLVINDAALAGHTRARPITLVRNPVWDLSTARVDQFRQRLEGAGLAAKRIRRIAGHADRSPAVSDPMDLRNNRLELILLRSESGQN
ncbi:chemotaxis protein MotB [Roseovarius mucosus]|uniref:OmpA/MotB family protein n=1 Tax=Roseovarius mucosus TaxID=215743 RepID=UPI001C5D632C|nr:flagellar motor protein MotB [Roseovarius mucosus]MBW4974499.1 chemotaxis protein MotB [Roseovarius mucosus]